MKTLIKKLVESIGPSGYETAVREFIKEEISSYSDEIRVDALGNLLVRKGTRTSGGLKIMLAAHMDEIGIIATHIDERGFVRFTTLGGVRPANCVAGRVQFINGAAGVIGMDRLENASQGPSIEQLYIDLGATSPDDCPVKVGDVAAFSRPMLELGDRIAAKSMDDRIGVAVLIETLKQLRQTPHEIAFVFSVQEEVGLRGATTAAFALNPDLGLSVDVTMTGDTPKTMKMEVSLGKGPAIKVRDGRMLADPRVNQMLMETAEKENIPYQLEILEGGTTDASVIQLTHAGVPSSCISIPCRYVHSPSEMVDYNDVQNAVRLLVAFLSAPIRLD